MELRLIFLNMNRLFDFLETNAELYPNKVLFGYKENNEWKKIYFKDALVKVHNLATSLLELLGTPKEYTAEGMKKVGIISNNRPEWIMADLATQEAGAILTPIYITVGLPDLEFIIRDADIQILFVSNQEIYDRYKSVFDLFPNLKIYSFDKVTNVSNWETLLIQKSVETALEISKSAITEDTIASIIYTSGTTGTPKGVMLSHKNIVSNVKNCMSRFTFLKGDDIAFSFLPLNHIFEKMLNYVYLYRAVTIYYAESIDTIGENLKEVRPHFFTCVPRVLEKVYDKIVAKGHELTGIKKALFFWALRLAKRYDNHKNLGPWYNFQLALANKLIFSKWREALGGRVRTIISGSSALNPDLIRIFSAAHIVIMEGYGLTETSPVISVNTYENEDRHIGTVGPLIDNVEVKIADDGEIYVKGDNVMMGYYKCPEQTKETFTDDGWLMTGDIGTFVDGKYLKITDRKKEIFKTSGGKYVAPQYVENIYRSVDVINQIIIVGENKKFVSALIVPDWTVVAKKMNNDVVIPYDERDMWIKDSRLIELVKKGIEWANPKINHIEQVKQFRLLKDEWTVDNGLLTPKLSLKRKIILSRFEKEIDDIYASS